MEKPAEKFKVYLWSIPAPAIIVPWPTGVVYCQQAGGCGCLPMEQEGFVVPFQNEMSREYPAFNPAVWYEKGNLEPFPPPKDAVPSANYLWKPETAKLPYREVAEKERMWKSSVWFEDICDQIEGLEFPSPHVKQIKVRRDIPQVEAWLRVEILACLFDICGHSGKKPKFKWADAILTWENSD